jgi:cell division control protein 6
MSLFASRADVEVFDDRDVLLDEHIPDELVGRDRQIEDYLEALMPVFDGHSPEHVFLFGPNGSGKTATTRFMLRELRADLDEVDQGVDLSTIWCRCNSIGTDYMLAIKLANRLLPAEDQVNRGHAEDVVYDRLFGALEDVGGTILIVLDEIDRIEDLDTFMYEITRARSAGGRLDDTKVGVVGISKNRDFYENLSSDVKSSLNDKTIDFPAYEGDDLKEILENRVESAFATGVVSKDVAPLCAAYAAKHKGDARFGLDLLRKSGDLAKRDELEQVTEEHVKKARDDVVENRLEKELDNMTNEAMRTVYALCVLGANGEDEPRTRTIYEKYRGLCETSGKKGVSNVQLNDYLSNLEDARIVEKYENRGDGGRFNRYSLRHDVATVVGAIAAFIENEGVVKSIESILYSVDDGGVEA